MENEEGTPEKTEKKITGPEEAAEMTRQRRKDFGLGEEREMTPEAIKVLDGDIERLLKVLNQYDFKTCSLERQDEWYWVEQEAMVGKDRELAKATLEGFLEVLRKEAGKTGD